ncbi:MAG: hypothetical protein EOL98_12065 [Negativicutes bacterium]|nr:hypothetical protein [Negativicutes bacterium]
MALGAYLRTCSKHTPGNQSLILFPADKVQTLTVAASVVTDLVLTGTEKAYYAEFDTDGLKRTEEGVTTKGGLFYVNQKIEAKFSKASLSMYNFIKGVADQSPCGLGAIVIDSNSNSWLMGTELKSATEGEVQGLYLSSSNFDSGMAINEDDMDMYTVTLERVIKNYSLPISGAIQAATSGEITTTIIT